MRRSACSLLGLLLASWIPLLAACAQVIELRSPNEEAGGGFGSVGVVPDVNGDGLDDILVGAGQEDVADATDATDAGRAYIFDGVTRVLLHTLISPNAEVGGFFGGSISGVPDVNGDGRGDVVVGAGQEDVGTIPNAGRAYVFDGSTGLALHTLVSATPAEDGKFGGVVAGFGMAALMGEKLLFGGNTVSGIADVNGDGRGDVVVGAWTEEGEPSPINVYGKPYAGRAYVFDGSSGSALYSLRSPNEEYGGRFGVAVSGVPDSNGDGRGDFVVGASFEGESGGGGNGRAYIFDGSNGTLLQSLISPNPEYGQILQDIGGLFGNAVSGIPDVSGDGHADAVVGAFTEGPEGSGAGYGFDGLGRAYIFDGSSGEVLHTLESPTGVIRGMFGCSVAGIGDIDGDGFSDVAVGAIGEINGGGRYPPLESGGRVHLISGSTGEALDTLVSPNETIGGFFGVAVSGIEDLNGDGLGEVLVGARNEGPNGSPEGAGRMYLFLSPLPTPIPTLVNPRSDINQSGEVDAFDLLILIADWKKVTAGSD